MFVKCFIPQKCFFQLLEYLVLLHFNVSLHMSIVTVFVKNKVDLGTPHWAFTNKEGSWVFSN